MRCRSWVLALTVAAGCSFSRSNGATSGDDDSPPVDASSVAPDAACDDDDGDGVCNDDDTCAGHDDHADGDADGTPDGCDTWRCGAQKPADPGVLGLVGLGSGTSTLSLVSLGSGPVVMAAPNQVLDLDYGFALQVGCPIANPTCRAQIEFGFETSRLGCLFDGDVVTATIKLGGGQGVDVIAPATPGIYRLRAKVVTAPRGCGSSTAFTGGAPPEEQTFAIVCVPP